MCQLEVWQLLHCPEIIRLRRLDVGDELQVAAVACDELVKIENNLHLTTCYYPWGKLQGIMQS